MALGSGKFIDNFLSYLLDDRKLINYYTFIKVVIYMSLLPSIGIINSKEISKHSCLFTFYIFK